jgi:hypothetical protein
MSGPRERIEYLSSSRRIEGQETFTTSRWLVDLPSSNMVAVLYSVLILRQRPLAYSNVVVLLLRPASILHEPTSHIYVESRAGQLWLEENCLESEI